MSLAALIALSIAARTLQATPGPAEFFVSPQGKDSWSGKLADPNGDNGPFATVSRARDAVRELLKLRREPRPVRVVLRGGTYYLNQPWDFSAVVPRPAASK